jgi:hypothetical protein
LVSLVPTLACTGGGGQADGGTDADTDADADSDIDTDTGTDECANVVCDQECVRFADVEAATGGDGLSWDTAFQKIQPAIDAAAAWAACCETPCQVRIARGTYYVYESSVHDTIDLADRVQIYGSFSKGEGDHDERDIEANPTILDGRAGPESEDRVYHVVNAKAEHEDGLFTDVILDGLTITQGAALGEISSEGSGCAGLYWGVCGNLIVRQCSFVENESVQGGSGACFAVSSGGDLSVNIEDSLFSENHGWMEGDVGYGGALLAASLKELTIRRCRFDNNSADVGAALVAVSGHDTDMQVVIENSVFRSNLSNFGYAVNFFVLSTSTDNNNVHIYNCVFYDNPRLQNPPQQDARFRAGFKVTMRNSIDIDSFGIVPSLEGNNLVDIDPLFLDPENGDFRLQPGSPCIDAADGTAAPEFDFLGNPRTDDPGSPNTGLGPPWADIGAFEFQPE